MDSAKKEKLLKKLSTKNRNLIQNLGKSAQNKVLKKIEKGYTISGSDFSGIEVKKGYSYYRITRGGSIWNE
jgi:hypothetical protein